MHIVGPARDDAARLHVPAGSRLGRYNLSRRSARSSCTAGILLLISGTSSGAASGARPPGRTRSAAATLEWTTTSPPPEYNFAVIPTVTSAVPELGPRRPGGRPAPARSAGTLVLDEGHETPASTVRDGDLDEVLEMPSESPWPVVVALAPALVFAMLLLSHFVLGVRRSPGSRLLAVAGWHSQEPEQSNERRSRPDRPRPRREGRTAGGGWRSSSRPRRRCSATLIGTYFYLALHEPAVAAAGRPGAEGRWSRSSCTAALVATSIPDAARVARRGAAGCAWRSSR